MIQGKVTEVSINPIGDEAVNVHTVGETEIRLYDATDFDEVGGKVKVGTDVYTYTSKSDDLDTLYLDVTTPLVTAIAEGDKVYLEPYGEEKVAQVTLELGEDAILAIVPHNIQDRLRDGIRDTDAQETVYCEKIEGVWYIREVSSELPSIDGWYIDPNTLPDPETPTDPPASSPDPIVTGGPDFFVIRSANQASSWAQANIEYHVTTDGSVPTAGDAATKLGETKGVLVAKKLPDGSDFSVGVDYHFRAIAKNVVGYGPVSNDVVARLDTTAVESIIASEITAGFILAGRVQVGQGYIDANEGIVLPQPDGTTTRFPVDGITPATISGFLIANGMVARDGAYFYGISQISGNMLLNDGIPNPQYAPTVTLGWEMIQSSPYSMGSGLTQTKNVGFYASFFGNNGGDRSSISILEANGDWVKDVGLEPNHYNPSYSSGVVRYDNAYYVLGQDLDRGGAWYVYIYDVDTVEALANFDYSTNTPFASKTGEFLVSNDSTLRPTFGGRVHNTPAGAAQELLVAWKNTSNVLQVRRYNLSGGTVATHSLSTLAANASVTGVAIQGVEGFVSTVNNSGNKILGFSVNPSTLVWTINTSLDMDHAHGTWYPQNLGVIRSEETDPGLGWDQIVSSFGYDIARYSIISGNNTYDVGYTWWDSNPTGGEHETKLSPTKSGSGWTNGKYLIINCPPAPQAGVTDPLLTDKANRVRVYFYNAGVGGYRAFILESQPPVDENEVLIMYPWNDSPSHPPPSVNEFLSTEEATGTLESQTEDGSGALIKLAGDGTWRLGELSAGTNGLLTGDSARLGKTAKAASTNWNNATLNGWWIGTNLTNGPLATGKFLVQVIAESTTNLIQIATQLTTGATSRWRRDCVAGTWGSWQRDGVYNSHWRTTDVSVAHNTWSTVPFPTGNNDPEFTGTTTFTIPHTGRYSIVGQVAFRGNATGRRSVRLLHNGATTAMESEPNVTSAGSGPHCLPFSCVLDLAGGDTIEVQAFQTSGAALNLAGTQAYTFVNIDRIR